MTKTWYMYFHGFFSPSFIVYLNMIKNLEVVKPKVVENYNSRIELKSQYC